MRRIAGFQVIFLLGLFLCTSSDEKNFKIGQLRFPRVRQAYKDKGFYLKRLALGKGYPSLANDLYIRIFKAEKMLEVWTRGGDKKKFTLLTSYPFCNTSGTLGPKRKQGDSQIPEGFYYIDRFNPASNFYLSLGINYPNFSDRKRAVSPDAGGDIFIHGNCVTIGCIPITDDKIKELYILAVEAKASGQNRIPVHIFPARLDETNWLLLQKAHQLTPGLLLFWSEIKPAYTNFQKTQLVPKIAIDRRGKYVVQ